MKKVLLKLTTYLTSIAPMGVYLGLNFDKFFGVPKSGIAFGALFGIMISVVALRDKFGESLKNNAQLKLSAGLLIFFWAVQAIASQLIPILALSTVGCLGALIPEHYYKKLTKVTTADETARILAEALKESK